MLNILAYPADAFDDIRSNPPRHVNWLAPLLTTLASALVFTSIVFSQPGLAREARELKNKAIEQQVAKGKMSKEAADQAEAKTDQLFTPSLLKLVAGVGAVFSTIFFWLLAALGTWILGRWILGSAPFTFFKAAELSGLSLAIVALGNVIKLFLVLLRGTIFATPSLALFVEDFDSAKPAHLALASADLIDIWFLSVLASGVGRLCGARWWKPAAWIFGAWLLLRGAAIAYAAWR